MTLDEIDRMPVCDKVDHALSLGIPAEAIGAALMVENGLDPGKTLIPASGSLDSLLSTSPAASFRTIR